jgi:hypothetical protein
MQLASFDSRIREASSPQERRELSAAKEIIVRFLD